MPEESLSNLKAEDEVASLFPLDLSGKVVVLRACIDASGRESGVYFLAAVAFGYDRAVKANRKWKELLGVKTFHMADLRSLSGEFSGISDDDVAKTMRGTIGIVREYASFFTAVSCDKTLIQGKPAPKAAIRLS